MSQQHLIDLAKQAIESNDFEALQAYFDDVRELDLDWPSVFQKVYLHACLKGSKEIASWMQDTVFPTMDPIQQIGLRQVFSYGRHLLKRVEKN